MILGLIVGGIVGGSALVHQAGLQSIIRQKEGITTAINTFQMQYDALPGDFDEAGAYWPAPACETIGGPLFSCNGNGNGVIDWGGPFEVLRMWQHLSLADIYPNSLFPAVGSYNNGAPLNYVAGYNVPKTKINGVAFSTYHSSQPSPTWGHTGHIIVAGANSNSVWLDAAFHAKDARGIDRKLDDGAINTGIIRANETDVGMCVFWQFGIPYYALSAAEKGCTLLFVDGW